MILSQILSLCIRFHNLLLQSIMLRHIIFILFCITALCSCLVLQCMNYDLAIFKWCLTSFLTLFLSYKLALLCLARLTQIWAYPSGGIETSSTTDEIQIIGGSGLLSHLIISYPVQFVATVFIPIIKSVTCYQTVLGLLKSVRYKDFSPEDSFHMIIEYLSPYVYSATGVAMHIILESISSNEDSYKSDRKEQKLDVSRDKELNENLEYMFYYVQLLRKDNIEQMIIQRNSQKFQTVAANNCSNGSFGVSSSLSRKISDSSCGKKTVIQGNSDSSHNSCGDEYEQTTLCSSYTSTSTSTPLRSSPTKKSIIWFHSLESLVDRDPTVLYRILMSEHVQK